MEDDIVEGEHVRHTYRPFPVVAKENGIAIEQLKLVTRQDPRGELRVYRYTVEGKNVMWDREKGYVYITSLLQLCNVSKRECVRLSNCRKLYMLVLRGSAPLQGTWLPFSTARVLCQRIAWKYKDALVPIFGPNFPSEALPPDHPHHGCLLLDTEYSDPSVNPFLVLDPEAKLEAKKHRHHFTTRTSKSRLRKERELLKAELPKLLARKRGATSDAETADSTTSDTETTMSGQQVNGNSNSDLLSHRPAKRVKRLGEHHHHHQSASFSEEQQQQMAQAIAKSVSETLLVQQRQQQMELLQQQLEQLRQQQQGQQEQIEQQQRLIRTTEIDVNKVFSCVFLALLYFIMNEVS